MSIESAQGGFGGAIAAGSGVQIQLVISGQALPVIGPFVAPANFSFQSQAYSLSPPANPVGFDVRHTFTFAAGSQVGAIIYNALTPGSSVSSGGNADISACVAYDGGGATLPIYRTPGSSPRDTTASGYGVMVCQEGSGSSLPIYRTGPQPEDSAASASSCGATADSLSDRSLRRRGSPPVVVFQGGCSDVACEGGPCSASRSCSATACRKARFEVMGRCPKPRDLPLSRQDSWTETELRSHSRNPGP